MGNSAPQRDARSLREILAGLDRVAQHQAAAKWAVENGRSIDMFGAFARDRHLAIFQSGNECENWLDTIDNVLYKMNTLTHCGEDLNKLFNRIEIYNSLFPFIALKFVGFQIMSDYTVFPIFSQPFITGARLASIEEIETYMRTLGFQPTGEDGKYLRGKLLLWDIKPKNVLITDSGEIAVIDAEITVL